MRNSVFNSRITDPASSCYIFSFVIIFIKNLNTEKNWPSPSQTFSETFIFYYIFTIFNGEVCNISNANFLINQLKNIFTQNTWLCSSIPSKCLHSLLQNLLETSTFYHIFTSFPVDEMCYISNEYEPPNNSAKYQYF